MKTRHLKIMWLVPVLGFAVAAGGFKAVTAYRDFQRTTQSEEAFSATLDRLHADERICRALKRLHEGDVSAAAQRLDRMLCENILLSNAELATASGRQREYVQDVFVRIARLRPRNSEPLPGATLEPNHDQIKAERVLDDACAAVIGPSEGLAAWR